MPLRCLVSTINKKLYTPLFLSILGSPGGGRGASSGAPSGGAPSGCGNGASSGGVGPPPPEREPALAPRSCTGPEQGHDFGARRIGTGA